MKKSKLAVVIALIAVSMVTLVGSSYALFTKTLEGTKKVTVKTGTLKVDFTEGNRINLEGQAPVTDSTGQSGTPYTFTITNSGTINTVYSIINEEDISNTLNTNYIRYRLVGDNGYDSGANDLSAIGGNFITGSTLSVSKSVTYKLYMWVSQNATNDAQGKTYQSKIVVTSTQEGVPAAEELIAKANPESLDYNSATTYQKNQLWTFSHDATEQLGATTDYRYIGANPNNYVKFNNELWRIIGVFNVDDGTGKLEKRLKIIRNESIGDYSWDNKNTSTGAETAYGKNNWTDARLNYLLNEGHDSETYGGSLYWNRKSGTCYKNQNNTTVSCDFTTTGLTDSAKEMIGDAKWYLGGTANYTSSSDGLTSHFYGYERGTTVYSGRSTSLIGKVGLIYPSDYGYATSGNSSTSR